MSETQRAPIGTRLVGWLIIVSGLVQIVAGVAIIALQDDITDQAPDYSSGEVIAIGIVAVAFGLVYLFVGRGFLHLSRLALGLGLLFGGVGVVIDAAILLANGVGDAHEALLFSFFTNLVVLAASWSGLRARDRLGSSVDQTAGALTPMVAAARSVSASSATWAKRP